MLKDEQIKAYMRESEERRRGEDKKRCQQVRERIEEIERKKRTEGRETGIRKHLKKRQMENKDKRKMEQRSTECHRSFKD